LGVDSWVRGEGGSLFDFSFIQPICDLVLCFAAAFLGVELPEGIILLDKVRGQECNAVAQQLSDGRGHITFEDGEEGQDARAGFNPRGEVGDLEEGLPRAKAKATFYKGQTDLDGLHAVQVMPLR
jgi:hypothetical protein